MTYQTNILGTNNVLACQQYCPNATIHNCSSSEVFGRVPAHLVPINEQTPFHPASPYAISKCSADLVGRYFAEAYGMNLYYPNVYTYRPPSEMFYGIYIRQTNSSD